MTIKDPTLPVAAANDGATHYDRGVDFMLGRGIAADLGMAAAEFLTAADLDEPRGLYAAGMMYLKGCGLSADAEAASALLQKSSSLGHAPARKVLEALSQGKDVDKFQIVVADAVPSAAIVAGPGATIPNRNNPVTPMRTLAIVMSVLVVVGGSGAAYWTWSKQQSEQRAAETAARTRADEEQRARTAQAQQSAEAERQRVIAEAQVEKDKAAAAMREVEAERQRLAEQAEAIAKTEAQRQEAQHASTAKAPLAASPAPADDWNTMVRSAMPHLQTMLDAALANSPDTVVRASATIRGLPRPATGDRRIARGLNGEALADLKRQNYSGAAAKLAAAHAADPSDEEVATNLGFALVKAGKSAEARTALLRALYLNPGRSSAWYNLGLANAADDRDQAAFGAMLLTFQFAGNQQKSREWFERVAQDDSNSPALRRVAQRLLASPAVATAPPTVAPLGAAPQVAAAPPPLVVVPAANVDAEPPVARRSLTEFCGSKGNPISRSLCESRECKKPENRADPYCADFFKRSSNNHVN